MGIQPIDLSVVYSQMDNVSKFNASQNQLVQAANQQGRDKVASENLEKSKTVQNVARDETQSGNIKNNLEGGGSFGYAAGERRRKENGGKEEEVVPQEEISEPDLGQLIDIIG
ncbi:MAG: hypothetical protein K6G18_02695 [Treponema sp.]|nr:hypothetical protein [Treponema sp.]MCR5620743.1 hypothetical protein [Treponema sp.]